LTTFPNQAVYFLSLY